MEIQEHAVLYALLCKGIIEAAGKEKGEKLIKEFTESYGFKRGRRMRANSSAGDLNDYFINGEWKGKQGENLSKLSFEDDKTVSTVSKCAWYDTWKKYGLTEYGSYYCRYIDKAIVKGFDEDLVLNVEEAFGYGDDRCVFVWMEKADEEKVSCTEKKHILPFDFHCKEMFETALQVFSKHDLRQTAFDALKEWELCFPEYAGAVDLGNC